MYEYNMTTFSSLVWLPKAKKEVKSKVRIEGIHMTGTMTNPMNEGLKL